MTDAPAPTYLFAPLTADEADEVLVALEFYRTHLDRKRQDIPYPDDQDFIRRAQVVADFAEAIRSAKRIYGETA